MPVRNNAIRFIAETLTLVWRTADTVGGKREVNMKAERTLRVPTVVVGASLWTRPILLLAMALLPTIALAAAGSARAQSARSVRPAGMRTDAASTKVGRMSSVQLDTVD